ncbi:ATP-binding protein, partial [Azospirillum isscasi]
MADRIIASDYSIGDKLHHGALVSIYRGLRLSDGLPIVLKRLERPRPNSADVARLRREYALARRMAAPGIVEVLGLEDSSAGLTLVMRSSGGESLDRVLEAGRPRVDEILRIGIAAASALGALHARNIVHKDVSPSNIVWNRHSGAVELIDFGIAADLADRSDEAMDAAEHEGTPAFIAPEQTGRMNRGVDWRADFYGLGATLYTLLAGRPPFDGSDTLSVVHGHIARAPDPPDRIDPTVPRAVSQVILKLLAKDPEDRYQSAHGLRADLERCLSALAAGEEPAPFPLGSRDRGGRLRLPARLYGRGEQAARLRDACRRTGAGRTGLLLIEGPSGAGKSALVRELRQAGAEEWGGSPAPRFVEGKFDQYKRSVPYAAFVQAFDRLARHLLAKPEDRLAERREALARAVGSNGAVLTELIPAFALVLGEQPAVPRLGPAESELRFQFTVQNAVMALATADRPLLLFLDDLHWADGPSLDLLAALLANPDAGHLLVIGAVREDETPPGHPLHRTIGALQEAGVAVDRLRVGPLDEAAVCGLLADALGTGAEAVRSLAAVCRDKTGGNPFFLARFLESLHEAGLLAFDAAQDSAQDSVQDSVQDSAAGGWRWDLPAVAGYACTANVVELMVARLRRLPPETQRLLGLAACIGNRFAMAALAAAAGEPADRVAAALHPALEAELLRTGGGEDREFLHDQVQQAAYALIPPEECAATHLSIGRALLDRGGAGLRLFDAAGHVNQGIGLVTDPAERRRLARLNLDAARQAGDSAAFETALACAEAGLAFLGDAFLGDAFLGDGGWRSDYRLMLDLTEAAVGAACMVGDYARANRLAETLAVHARDPADGVPARFFLVGAATVRGDPHRAMAIGLDALRALGVAVPERGNGWTALRHLAMGWWAMVRHGVRPARPPIADGTETARRRLALRLLAVLGTASFVARRDLMVPIAMRSVRLGLDSGRPDFAAGAHVTW